MLPSFAFSRSAVQSDPFHHLKSKPNSISRRPRGAGDPSHQEHRALLPPLPDALTSEPTRRASPLRSQSSASCSSSSACGESESSSRSQAPRARHLQTDGRARGGACLKGVGSQVPRCYCSQKAPSAGPAPPYASPHPSIHPPPPHTSRSSLRLWLREESSIPS